MLRFNLNQNNYKRSSFRQNFVKTAKANLVVKVLPILAAPIVTRLFSPSDFATFAFYSATITLIGAVSTARFDWSIPNARTSSMATHLFVLGAGHLLVLTFFLTLLVILAGSCDLPWNGWSQLGFLIYLLPIGVFFLGCNYLLEGWFIRSNDLTVVSRARIFEALVQVCTRLVTGFWGMSVLGLVAASFLSSAVKLACLKLSIHALYGRLQHVKFARAKTAFTRYKYEAGWSTMVAALNALSMTLPILLLSQFYPPKEVGWYTFMAASALGPLSIFSSAIAQSFWGEAARLIRARQANTVRTLYLKITKRLFFLSGAIVLICAAGPFFVGPLLGNQEWSGAGAILMAMAPALVGVFVFSSTNHLVVYGMQKWQLISDVINIILVSSVILNAGKMRVDFEITVLFFSMSILFSYLLRFFLHLYANSRFAAGKPNF